MKSENLYDIIIVGSGPAGMTAAIYAGRAGFKTLMIEKGFAGGQVVNTYEVDNYPGLPGLSGIELSMKIQEHSAKFGVETITEEVEDVDLSKSIKIVKTTSNSYRTKVVIMATGARWRALGAPGEEAFRGKGVSYCATCDGAFFRDKVTAVIGGGDTAVEDAVYLSRFCKKVYLVHRRDELRAVKVLQERLFELENVEVIWDSVVKEIKGDDFVTSIDIQNKKTEEDSNVEVDGVFIAVGTIPNTALIDQKVEVDEYGYVICNDNCEMSIPGTYAAGDLRQKLLRQIITAASDGAVAVAAAERYLLEEFK